MTEDCSNYFNKLSLLWDMNEKISPSSIPIGNQHKTVVVVDHSPGFGVMSNHKIDISIRDSVSGQMRVVSAIEKSLWTCAVESALEFHRIVEEIFPDGTRLLRFVISDFVGRFLTTTWDSQLVPLSELLSSFTLCGIPDAKADLSSCSIINGISMAIEAISELTNLQKKHPYLFNDHRFRRRSKNYANNSAGDIRSQRYALNSESIKKKILFANKCLMESSTDAKKITRNTGSIVVFTSIKTDEEITVIEKHITEDIINRNKIIKALDDDENFAPIMHVNVYIVCLIPVSNRSDDERITSKPLTKINEHVSCCVRCAEADPSFRSVVHSVIMDQYDLVSTTVTSIPMKEEAQQGQSVNYDVEVFHPRRSYIILEKLNLIDSSSKLRSRQLGGYDTIQLSWTTPSAKNRWNQYPRCISAVPVSPASVNSRPSVCLTSFLLGGRNVMLEVLRQNIDSARDIPPNINQKLISHLLMCHAGHIFMHTLWVGEHPLFDDKKLIAAAQMPQVDGLRVIDFGALMKECHLIVPPTAKKESANTYNERARKHLKRLTRFWPLLLTDAFIYNIPKKFEPLLSLIKKRELSTSDVNKCREFFHTFMSYKDTKEPLTAKTINCIKFKNPLSRDEQFRISCNEILNHLRNYVNHSERHLEVFNVFLQISGLDRSTHLSIVDVSLIDCKSIATKTCIDGHNVESRSNSPPAKKSRKNSHLWASSEKLNLYDFFLKKYQKERWSKWKDFVGRQNSLSNPVVLYPHLDVSKSGKAIEIDQ